MIIEAANEVRKLFPGMTANVAIVSDIRDDVSDIRDDVSDTRDGALRVSNDAFRFKPKTAH